MGVFDKNRLTISRINRRDFLTAAVASVAATALPMIGSTSVLAKDAQESNTKNALKKTSSDLVRLEKRSALLWQVTFENPPFNLVVPEMVSALHSVILEMNNDPEVKVILFKSDTSDYFVNHFDLAKANDFPVLKTNPPTPVWVDIVLKLSKSPVISIASIRGRTRGGGNEFALACDMRYASLEKAFFGQPEVGAGILPGGGGTERLPRLIGRDRALEAILSSQDYDAKSAENVGWVTRALPDIELDSFVENLAKRLTGFDKQALAGAKAQINRATLPPDEDLFAAYQEYSQSLSWQGFKARRPRMAKVIAEHGLDQVELNLGHFTSIVN